MRGRYAMPEIVNALVREFVWDNPTAIELFARDGLTSTIEWAWMFNRVVGIDINPQYAASFAKNIGNSEAYCFDSIAALNNGALENVLKGEKFDLVSVDSPSCLFGNYCEHFQCLGEALSLCKDVGYLMFSVNLHPFKPSDVHASLDDYGMTDEKFDKWMNERNRFYGGDATTLTREYARVFYRLFLEQFGVKASLIATSLREAVGHKPNIYYMVYKCEK